MFDGGGVGCVVCCSMPILVILLIIAIKVLEKIFDRRWLP